MRERICSRKAFTFSKNADIISTQSYMPRSVSRQRVSVSSSAPINSKAVRSQQRAVRRAVLPREKERRREHHHRHRQPAGRVEGVESGDVQQHRSGDHQRQRDEAVREQQRPSCDLGQLHESEQVGASQPRHVQRGRAFERLGRGQVQQPGDTRGEEDETEQDTGQCSENCVHDPEVRLLLPMHQS